MSNPTTNPPLQPQPVPSSNPNEEVSHIQLAGLTVVMIKTKDQVIYKLPDHMSVNSLTQQQRDSLLEQINLLHQQSSTAATQQQAPQTAASTAATAATTSIVAPSVSATAGATSSASGRSISGSANGSPSALDISIEAQRLKLQQIEEDARRKQKLLNASIATQEKAGSPASSTYSPVATPPAGRSTPTSAATGSAPEQKTTRKYNKTGKYSKKKQALLAQQLAQQQQQSQPQALAQNNQSRRQGSTDAPKAVSVRTPIGAVAAPLPPAPTPAPTPIQALTPGGALQLQQLKQLEQQLLQQHRAQQLSTEKLAQEIGPDKQPQLQLWQQMQQLNQAQQLLQVQYLQYTQQNQECLAKIQRGEPVDEEYHRKLQAQVSTSEKALQPVAIQLQQKQQLYQQLYPNPSAAANKILMPPVGNSASAAAGAMLATTPGYVSASGNPHAVAQKLALDREVQNRITNHHTAVKENIKRARQEDELKIEKGDLTTPFKSFRDALERLVPYHVFQYPSHDIEKHAENAPSEEAATATAKDFHEKKRKLMEKYTDLLKRGANNSLCGSNGLEIYNAKLMLDDEKTYHKKTTEEYRSTLAVFKAMEVKYAEMELQKLQQRKAEELMIEQQQKMMLERLANANKANNVLQKQNESGVQGSMTTSTMMDVDDDEEEMRRRNLEEQQELVRQRDLAEAAANIVNAAASGIMPGSSGSLGPSSSSLLSSPSMSSGSLGSAATQSSHEAALIQLQRFQLAQQERLKAQQEQQEQEHQAQLEQAQQMQQEQQAAAAAAAAAAVAATLQPQGSHQQAQGQQQPTSTTIANTTASAEPIITADQIQQPHP